MGNENQGYYESYVAYLLGAECSGMMRPKEMEGGSDGGVPLKTTEIQRVPVTGEEVDVRNVGGSGDGEHSETKPKADL